MSTGAARFVALFAAIGIVIAALLNAFWWMYERSLPHDYYVPILKGTLVLFPASIGTIAIGGANYWSVDHFVLIGMNGVVYAIGGLLVWLGFRKHRAFFAFGLLLFAALVGAV